MGRVVWIKTDSFFFLWSVSRREAEAERQEKRWKRNERRSREREREREKESEEEKEESGGGTQRGKWCSKKPASTLDWNLKVPGLIPGSTLREIIHPKTTDIFGYTWSSTPNWKQQSTRDAEVTRLNQHFKLWQRLTRQYWPHETGDFLIHSLLVAGVQGDRYSHVWRVWR